MAYNYPNARNNPAGAMPVYIVPPPTPDSRGRFSNAQNNPNSAIPVNFVAQPTTPSSGAIPVRIVAGPGVPDAEGRWPSDQGQDRGAIPVYDNAAGMPVWAAVGIPPVGLPVNTTPPSITPVGPIPSGDTLTANPGIWTNSPTNYLYQWTRNGANIGGATISTYLTTIVDRNGNIGINIVAQNATGDSVSVQSSNIVHVLGPPVNVIPSSISPAGPANVGDTLTMSTGTWTNNPTSYNWNWRRNGSGIPGAVTNTYVTDIIDAGAVIDGINQAMNADGGSLGTLTSNQITVNSPPPIITPAVFNVAFPLSIFDYIGQCIATNNPTAWAIVESGGTPTGLFTIGSTGVVTATAQAANITIGTYTYDLYASNAAGPDQSTLTINVT